MHTFSPPIVYSRESFIASGQCSFLHIAIKNHRLRTKMDVSLFYVPYRKSMQERVL
jgi:hypothetical protein